MWLGRLFGRGRQDGADRLALPAKTSTGATEPEREISPARLDAALDRLRKETPEPQNEADGS
jgi:hypothetical protein